MKRYMLLSANNIDMDIDIESYLLLEDAKQEMESQWKSCKESLGSIEEENFEDMSASLFTGGSDGDLYYWQIKEVEV